MVDNVWSGPTYATTQNAFATAARGGLNYLLADHIAIKPTQVEYLMTFAAPQASAAIRTTSAIRLVWALESVRSNSAPFVDLLEGGELMIAYVLLQPNSRRSCKTRLSRRRGNYRLSA